jgi:hypothetical protein
VDVGGCSAHSLVAIGDWMIDLELQLVEEIIQFKILKLIGKRSWTALRESS